jgi:hypothetical protein
MTKQENAGFNDLKQKLLAVGIPIPGTIHALYARCGSPTCPCASDDTKRHGPYYRWHYRLQGRIKVQGIDKADMPQFQEWIENREKIYKIVEELLKIGVRQAIARAAPAKSSSQNSEKPGSRMRGK